MYIESIEIKNFRTFRESSISFCYKGRKYGEGDIPKPKLPNMNLLLANNGYGKTSLLKAIALSALGPSVGHSGIYPYRLIRREKGSAELKPAVLKAKFKMHPQDASPFDETVSHIEVRPEGDLEILEWNSRTENGESVDEKAWHPVFSSNSDAFFMVGYGSTRRVSKSNRVEQSGKSSPRASRIMGLFEEDFSLRPLNSWLPTYFSANKGRYVQVEKLLNSLVGSSGWRFTGKQDNEGEYLFSKGGIEVPFPALSDGYRAFLGWLGDLLFHVCETCPSGKKLVENCGIVLVDEIDLHLHPKWQMTVLAKLAKELPNIQFIVTSHSPLVVSSLEWMNIVLMDVGPRQSSIIRRVEWAVHGLDADQILLTDFFGLKSTRAPGMKRKLKDLSMKASEGDITAAVEILKQMSTGMEALG